MSDASPASAKQLPYPDRDSERYWAAACEGRLELQRCSRCKTWRWPAREICHRCHSFDYTWQATSGRGRIASWVVTHQPFAAGWQDELPYVVVSVALDDAPEIKLYGNLLSGEPAEGLPVRATFPQVAEGVHLVQWEAVPSPPAAD